MSSKNLEIEILKINLTKVSFIHLSRGGAKWEAWKAVEGLSKEEAQQK